MIARSNSRGGARVIWLAVHDTEGGGTAKTLRDASWWEGSSHAIADNLPESQGGGLLTPEDGTVPYERSAWTLRNGNPISDNIELVGMASWSRAKWLSQPLLLDRCARWLADRSKARGIPLRRLTLAEIRAKQPGVIGHGDYTNATGDGTHWDPGPGFPWDVVLAKANSYASGGSEEDEIMGAADDIIRAIREESAKERETIRDEAKKVRGYIEAAIVPRIKKLYPPEEQDTPDGDAA